MRSNASSTSAGSAERGEGSEGSEQRSEQRQVRQLLKMANKIHSRVLSAVRLVTTRPDEGWGEAEARPDDYSEQLVSAASLIESSTKVYSVVSAKLSEILAGQLPLQRRACEDALTRVRTLLFQSAALEREIKRARDADEAAMVAERLEAGRRRKASIVCAMAAAEEDGRPGAREEAVRKAAALAAAAEGSLSAASARSNTTASSGRKLSCKSLASSTGSSVNEILAWARDLELDPPVRRALERALRGGGARRGSLTEETASSAISGSSSDNGATSRCSICWQRCMARYDAVAESLYIFALRFHWLYVLLKPFIRARHMIAIYLVAALLAPVGIFMPSLALGLGNEDFGRWARCAWQAALVDALLLQPAFIALRVRCLSFFDSWRT